MDICELCCCNMQLGWTRLGYGHYIGLTRRCAVKWVDGSTKSADWFTKEIIEEDEMSRLGSRNNLGNDFASSTHSIKINIG